MSKKCVICKEEIEESYGKLKGSVLKIIEHGKNNFIYVCSSCQKNKNWIEEAKVKSA